MIRLLTTITSIPVDVIAWEYRNGKYDRVDKEIKFEEFHDWLIEKLSGEWTK